MYTTLKQKVIDWCLNKQTVQIGELHRSLHPLSCEIYDEDTNKVKFIEQTYPQNILIETPTGYSKIKHSHKTVEYQIWEVQTENHQLECADTHIVIDEHGQEVYVKDLYPGKNIQTKNKPEQVISVTQTCQSENMYDIELDDSDHVYYTNGILSHNSISSAIYLLWFAIFHFDKKILIASNKNKGAMEMIRRIRYAYENLPVWLKPGVTDDGWNKHSVAFDNDSRIDSTATSEDAGRGESISLLFLDEFAFVKPSIQKEFWTSILPTLSTGGSCIMSSTPNGDSDLFATLWRSAVVSSGMQFEDEDGNTETLAFSPMHIEWDAPPGRGEKFKRGQIALIGEQKWKQEYECEFLSSEALLIDSVFLAQLTPIIKQTKALRVHKGVSFWTEIKRGGTYLIGVDPATGSGRDFSVIEVFEFPSMEQVAEYRSNSMSSPAMYKLLKGLIKHIESYETTIYFSVENNGVGEGIISLYEADETPPELSEFVSEVGATRRGMTTTKKTKMKACLNLKEMLEKNNLKINSKLLLAELKTYIRHAGSYSAQYGSTDDCISAVLIIMRILEEISSYDQTAHDKLHAIDDDEDWWDEDDGDAEEEPMPVLF